MAGAQQAKNDGQARDAKKGMTPKFRVSFPYLFEKAPPMAGSASEPKYEMTMLFDAEAQKTPHFQAMKRIALAAAKEKFGDKVVPDGKGWFKGVRSPFRDGAEKVQLDGYGEGVAF